MRVAFFSSAGNVKCGIAVYTEHIRDAIIHAGNGSIESKTWSSRVLISTEFPSLISWNPDVLHLQYEQALFPEAWRYQAYIKFLKQHNPDIRVVTTLHSDTDQNVNDTNPITDIYVLHKPSSVPRLRTARLVPSGIPVYELQDRYELRHKYHFDPTDVVLTTFGFMFDWKNFPEVLQELTPWLRKSAHNKVQLLTSYSDYNQTTVEMGDRIVARVQDIVKRSEIHPGQVIHKTDFLPDQEITERLQLSDWGYIFAPFDTGSISAAITHFTSARIPVVASDSTHYSGLKGGVVPATKDPVSFAAKLIDTVGDYLLHEQLTTEQEAIYTDRNFNKIGEIHVQLYHEVVPPS